MRATTTRTRDQQPANAVLPRRSRRGTEVGREAGATQRFGGNQAAQRLLAPETEARRRVAEAATGYDLSGIRIVPSSARADAAGVEAFTEAGEVHLASRAPGPQTEHGRLVLGHELAHAVQQGTGRASTADYAALEHEAAQTSRVMARQSGAGDGGGSRMSLRSLSSPVASVRQPFDPRYHRESLVQGLAGSGFSDAEIGAMYGANWERDFSQASPLLGNVVLRWKAVKIAAYESRLTQTEVDDFNGSISAVITLATSNPSALMDESYGGYRYWEHMDNPGQDPNLTTGPNAARLRGELLSVPPGGAVPRYMLDSRDYIKAQLFNAANAYRGGDLAGTHTADTAQTWQRREADLRSRMSADATAAPGGLRSGSAFPPGQDPASREAAIQAAGHGAPAGSLTTLPSVPAGAAPRPGFTPDVAQGMGRASHALEDFFAHSTFVELAIGEPNVATMQATGPVTGQLGTGTFGAADKKHALAHKLRALADEILSELPAVNRAAGRTSTDPTPGQVHVGTEAEPREVHEEPHGWLRTLGSTGLRFAGKVAVSAGAGLVGGGAVGSLLGPLGTVAGAAGGLVLGVRHGLTSAVRDVLATSAGAEMLKRVAEKLEDSSRAEAQLGSHTLLAKDQPGHEQTAFELLRTLKFHLAQACAAEADRRVLGPMHEVFDAPTAAGAETRLEAVHSLLDQMIAPPSGHPLEHDVIEPHRLEAEAALRAMYPALTEGMGDLVPGRNRVV